MLNIYNPSYQKGLQLYHVEIPVLVRSVKFNNVGPGQYLDRQSLGNAVRFDVCIF